MTPRILLQLAKTWGMESARAEHLAAQYAIGVDVSPWLGSFIASKLHTRDTDDIRPGPFRLYFIEHHGKKDFETWCKKVAVATIFDIAALKSTSTSL